MEYHDAVEGRTGSQDMAPIPAHLFQGEVPWNAVNLAVGYVARHKAVCVVTERVLRYVSKHRSEQLKRQPIYVDLRILNGPHTRKGAREKIEQF